MKKHKWTIGAICLTLVAAAFMVWGTTAEAADLGGDCCADLEERIAELEATAAKKGNRRTTLTVYGRVSEAIVWTDWEDYSDWSVGSNSNAPSFVGFIGGYQLRPGLKAKYAIQIGLGGYEANVLTGGYGHLEGDTHGLYLRNASLSLESDTFGAFTIGKTRQATDGISQIDTSKSWIASQPLTFRPITGEGLGEVLEMDGTRANVVRWDSPELNGFWVSASASPSNTDLMGNTDGMVWDVAARYWGDVGAFKVGAGVGYREGIWIEDDALIGVPLMVAIDENLSVVSGSASVMHKPSGVFLNGTYGSTDFDVADVTIDGYAVKAGIEMGGLMSSGKGFGSVESLNKTTAYVEYGKWDLSDLMVDDVDYYGLGVVQTYGAVSLYASGRKYDLMGTDATVIMAGMSMDF